MMAVAYGASKRALVVSSSHGWGLILIIILKVNTGSGVSIPIDDRPPSSGSRRPSAHSQAQLQARRLLWSQGYGVLSTASRRAEGWPFGSIVPYALDGRSRPLIYVATLAEHYKNLSHDPRTSLLVSEVQGRASDHQLGRRTSDVQAFGRITIMARAEEVPEEDRADARARYRFRVPSAQGYQDTHNFKFFRLVPDRVRYIGGFGSIHWIEGASFTVDPGLDPLRDVAAGAIDHMNEDHVDALRSLLRCHFGVDATAVRMTGLDQRGLWIEADDHYRVEFPRVATPNDLRQVMVETVRQAREG
jgi:hypothetical protein